MNAFIDSSFYPTPEKLSNLIVSRIQGTPEKILEPQAGKGDLIAALNAKYRYSNKNRVVSAIEINPDLQATLRGKDITVIDSDFLAYSGVDQFDLIISNPPFDTGDLHLLKALDIMYSGQVICLLNAETIKNPYTHTRQLLVKRLTELNAEVEYISGAFMYAERPTMVEVALVSVVIKREIEDDLFKDIHSSPEQKAPDIAQPAELSTKKRIEEAVAAYNRVIEVGKETIINYYRNYRVIGTYIGLNDKPERSLANGSMTPLMQDQLNQLVSAARLNAWRDVLEIPDISRRMTRKRQNEFYSWLNKHHSMEFTESNIRQFIINIVTQFPKTLKDGVEDIFDMFTVRHSYSHGLYDDNIHYFNGWKTNNAFKVKKRVIIPVNGGFSDGPFIGFRGAWDLHYNAKEVFDDIDMVMNSFDGMRSYLSMSKAVEAAFKEGRSSKIESSYFFITVYKKGTVHLEFKDDNILRRFNLAACMNKNWLPHEYGNKSYKECSQELQTVIGSFEGETSYNQHLNQPLFGCTTLPELEAAYQSVNTSPETNPATDNKSQQAVA